MGRRAYTEYETPNLLDDFISALDPTRVSIVEFAESEKYCGKPLFPRQRTLLKILWLEELNDYDNHVLDEWIRGEGGGNEPILICPMIRERMQFLREQGYRHFPMIQLVGGRRSSKGHISGITIAKKVYDMVNLGDPSDHFSVDRDKEVYALIVSAAKDQATKTQFADARASIESCVALQKYISRVREESLSVFTPNDLDKIRALKNKSVDVQRDIARIRVASMASNAGTVRGFTSFVIDFDEQAHMMAGESTRSDVEVFEAATPSLLQFGKEAMVLANSSPYTETGKFFELYQQSLEIENDFPVYPQHFMLQMPSWALYKDWEDDEFWKGKAPPASEDDPMVLGVKRANPEKYRVEYCGQFSKVIDSFLDPVKVDEMFKDRLQGRPLGTVFGGTADFSPYKAHGDPSSTTANFGIAVGHVEWIPNEETGVNESHVVFDLVDYYDPQDFDKRVVDWDLVLTDIVTYINAFRPYEWTFDQFDSTKPIQDLYKMLQEKNLTNTRVYSKVATAPVNRRRYDNFKAACYLGRVHIPAAKGDIKERALALCCNEFKFLQEKHGRVDKQDIGPVQTKDIADCIVEVTDALIGDVMGAVQDPFGESMAIGSQGGYGLGQTQMNLSDFYQEAKRTMGHNPARGISRNRRRH